MSEIIEEADIALPRLLWSIYINTDFAARLITEEIRISAGKAINEMY